MKVSPAPNSGRTPRPLAAGLRVPKAYGDYLILDILKKSGGTAVSVTDAEIMDAFRHWARVEGVFAAPEGAASLAAYRKLRASGFFSPEDKVVLFNTGSGLKYLDVIEGQKKRRQTASIPSNRRDHRPILGSRSDHSGASCSLCEGDQLALALDCSSERNTRLIAR